MAHPEESTGQTEETTYGGAGFDYEAMASESGLMKLRQEKSESAQSPVAQATEAAIAKLAQRSVDDHLRQHPDASESDLETVRKSATEKLAALSRADLIGADQSMDLATARTVAQSEAASAEALRNGTVPPEQRPVVMEKVADDRRIKAEAYARAMRRGQQDDAVREAFGESA